MALLPPATAGMALRDVDTPALVLDLDAFERNVQTMREAVRGSGVRLRPHAKSHKCPEIARRQLAAGAIGICCQKASEAEAFVDAGIRDVLIANEVVGASKVRRVAQLGRRARIAVCVDDARNVQELSNAANEMGTVIDVLVELDVGAGRCGVAPGEPAVQLVRAIKAAPYLHFAGIHAYHGAAQHVRDARERQMAIERAAALAKATRDALARYNIPCETITGAGTGSFLHEVASRVYNEVQPGSYIFMDADYARNDWTGFPRFEQSLFVVTTVMSTPAAGRVVCDAGLKASSIDSGMPQVAGWPGLDYVKASDEHGVITVAPGSKSPTLGDRLRLVPGHCDPTVNLYDHIVAVRGDRVEGVWQVSARGALW
jgi:D-serine deaminase-like pyridoxal phosphate-dependent protein